jgi:hypothetical protein
MHVYTFHGPRGQPMHCEGMPVIPQAELGRGIFG